MQVLKKGNKRSGAKKSQELVEIIATKTIGKYKKGTIYPVGRQLADELRLAKKAKFPGEQDPEGSEDPKETEDSKKPKGSKTPE